MTDQAALDIIMDELRDWEMSMDMQWTAADRELYMKKKIDNVHTFLMDQVHYWEGVMTKRESGDFSEPVPVSYATEPDFSAHYESVTPQYDSGAGTSDAEAAAEKAAADKAAADKAREAKAAADQAAAERAASDKAKAALDKAAADKEASDKAAADRAASDKAKQEKVTADRSASDKTRQDKVAADKVASEKAAADRLAAHKATVEKVAQERAAQEQSRADSKAAATAASPVHTPIQLSRSDGAGDDTDANLASERKDAILRIGRPATKQACDLTDPSVLEAYIKVRNDRDPLNWFILAYAPGSNVKLIVIACGDTSFEEMKEAIPEDAVYMYINFRFGDTQRSKFLFLTYVPDSLPGLRKSRVVGHRPAVEKLFKYMTLQWHVLDKHEMTREVLEKKLLSAGGANYSVQESNKGDFSSYKQTTREFYDDKDKATQLTGLVYQQGPLTTTPMDLSGRAMVAPQSELRANIKDLNIGK